MNTVLDEATTGEIPALTGMWGEQPATMRRVFEFDDDDIPRTRVAHFGAQLTGARRHPARHRLVKA